MFIKKMWMLKRTWKIGFLQDARSVEEYLAWSDRQLDAAKERLLARTDLAIAGDSLEGTPAQRLIVLALVAAVAHLLASGVAH